MFCKYCGYKLKKKDSSCKGCGHVITSDDVIYKKKNFLVCYLLIIVLLGVIGFGYYYVNKPEVIFNTVLKNVYEYTSSNYDKIDQVKMNMDIQLNISSNSEYEKITNLINDFKLNTSINVDTVNEDISLGVGIDYKEDSIAKIDAYLKEKEAYIDLNDLFNKIIKYKFDEKVEMNYDTKDVSTLLKYQYNAIKEALKVAIYSSEKQDNINKNTLIINNSNIKEVMSYYANYLSNNEEYINLLVKIFDSTYEEELKNINELYDLKEIKEIKIIIYTKALTNELVKVELNIKDYLELEYDISNKIMKMNIYDEEVNSVVEVNNIEKDSYVITSTVNNEDIVVKVTSNISFVYNEKNQLLSSKEVINSEELKEEDENYIMEKLIEKEVVMSLIEEITTIFSSTYN